LSITTFRYVPPDLTPSSEQVEAYLNQLNAELLILLQRSGEAFLSNAVVEGMFLLLAYIVNFRTSHIDWGQVGGLDVSHLSFVQVNQIPGNVLEGNWRAVFYIDDKATPAQQEAILNVFGGKLGGPWLT
jgi:Protein of unknown function (DUF1326)